MERAWTLARPLTVARGLGQTWAMAVGGMIGGGIFSTLGVVVGIAGSWTWLSFVLAGLVALAAVTIMALFIGLNLRGAGEAGGVEVVLVWFKLVVLVGLAGWGLARWDPAMLARGVPEAGIGTALLGAASVFMAFEGFQLLTYDYEEIEDADRTLPRAVLGSIVVVIAVYVLVALGTPMLIGAAQVVAQQEVALAEAGRQALGTIGLVIVTVAAAFGTLSASAAALVLTRRLLQDDPWALAFLAALVLVAVFGRPLIPKRMKSEGQPDELG